MKEPKHEPHVRVVTKPLPSQRVKTSQALCAGVSSPSEASSSQAYQHNTSASIDPFCRAENEDDDGYDPYSDRPATPEPLFEPDPWA